MPGRPILKKLLRDIDKAGGDEHIFDQIIAGKTIGAIMAEFEVSRQMFYDWLRAGGDGRKKAYNDAKILSSHALAEEGMEILDRLADPDGDGTGRVTPLETSEVTLARARADYRRYLAAVRNRGEYGKDQEAAVQVNVNVGDLHLDALRHHGSLPAGQPEIPEADYELEGAEPEEAP